LRSRRGFALTLTALSLFLILTSYFFMIMYFITPVHVEPIQNPDLSEEAYRSILRGAGAAASRSTDPDLAAEVYINASLKALSDLSQAGVAIPPFVGTGVGRLEPLGLGNFTYGVIYKSSSGTGGAIKMLNLPPGSEVVLADQDLNVVSKSTTGTLNFNREAGEYYIVAYTKDSQAWSYSGTVSINYKYTLQGTSITATSWSPPPGFPYILVYGVPQLSLVRVFDSGGTIVGEGLRDLRSNVTTVLVSLNTINGKVSVIAPNAWYFGIVRGGDVFVYG